MSSACAIAQRRVPIVAISAGKGTPGTRVLVHTTDVAPPSGAAPAAPGAALVDDETLMARVVEGDRTAFTSLARRHGRSLQRFAQRLLRHPDDADEVAQEALLRVWQHAARWQPERVRFTTWLYSIGHNLCIDRLRRRRNTASLDDEGWAALPAEPTPDDAPERAQDARDTRRQVELALARLPERQRSALVLCFYQTPDLAALARPAVPHPR